jgi:hypothetical protein
MMIFFALMIAFGVVFGTGALVVDTGYGMGQQTVMQNGADAGALAAAEILATSVDPNNTNLFVASDHDVYVAATQLATSNRSGGNGSSSYQTAVEFLKWDTTTSKCIPFSPQPYVAAGSDVSLVPGGIVNPYTVPKSVLGGLGDSKASSTELGSIPPGTCAIRVHAKVSYNSIFGGIPPISQPTEGALAIGTAQVVPAQMPPTGIWPTTHWTGDQTKAFAPGDPPVTFWDSNEKGFSSGNWKLLLDLSRCSKITPPIGPDPFNCAASPTKSNEQLITNYDPKYPGNSPKLQDDLDNWFTFGWHGQVKTDDARCRSLDPTKPSTWSLASCQNSRVEVDPSGDGGQNQAGDMRSYIDAHAQGVDTSGQNLGNYGQTQVFLWKYGEIGIDPVTNVGTSLYNGPPPKPATDNGNKVQRVIIDQVSCFRFYTGTNSAVQNSKGTIDGSQASGYYTSCLGTTADPSGGAPSATANLVKLVPER